MKRILTLLLMAAFLLPMFVGCGQDWREIPPSEYGEIVRTGQLDHFEIDDKDREWAVISFDELPYSVSCLANEEINSKTTKPGTWITLSFDGDTPFNMRLAVFA